MTRRRSLKRRIRARMKRTGESYTTARRHVTSRLEDQSRPAEVAPVSAQERRQWRRPVMIAAVGVALAGGIAAAIVVVGGGGDEDTANRYAATTPTWPSGRPWHAQRRPGPVEMVPCSEMMRPAQLAIDHPETCFRLRSLRSLASEGLRDALRRSCNRRGRCAFGLPRDQAGVVRQVARPDLVVAREG